MSDGSMSAVHFNVEAGPVRLVFAHANGFNAQAYSALLTKLPVHSVAFDLRGHGFTDLPTNIENLASFEIFANDIVAFIDRHVNENIVLAGHSLGASCAILASRQLQDRLVGYLGFDPVTLPSLPRYLAKSKLGRGLMKKTFPLAKNTGKRRRVFENPQQVFDRYSGRGAFMGLTDKTLNDFLVSGLRSNPNGVELSCDPLWEQAIYCAQSYDLYGAAEYLPKNSEIHYAGKHSVSTKKTRNKISRVVGEAKVMYHPEYHHMFPLQDFEFSVSRLNDCIERASWS